MNAPFSPVVIVLAPAGTVGRTYLQMLATPGWRDPSRTSVRQYEKHHLQSGTLLNVATAWL